MTIDVTKARILEAAYEQFIEKGYQGSSMRDIATRAGIKAGSIYNHFEGKEQIFEAVFIEKHPMFRILAILDDVQGANAEELLTNAVSRLNMELQNDSGLLNLFFVEFVEMGGKHIPQAIEKNFSAICTEFATKDSQLIYSSTGKAFYRGLCGLSG